MTWVPTSEAVKQPDSAGRLKRTLAENGLSLTLFALFLAFTGGQILSGHRAYNEELAEHGHAAVGLARYLTSGHFLEALFENWESEFLQMAAFVVLTVKLVQKGSSESKSLREPQPQDEDPRRHGTRSDAPWPVRRGGVWLKLYEHSLSIALFALFLASFAMHAVGGHWQENEEHLLHGQAPESLAQYITSSQFWFESFQNWQSEFFAVLAIVILSIFLRQRGSPQSKPVAAPHRETGG
jgi:uncharacterized protein DUF6766